MSMALPITERGCDIFGLGASLALRSSHLAAVPAVPVAAVAAMAVPVASSASSSNCQGSANSPALSKPAPRRRVVFVFGFREYGTAALHQFAVATPGRALTEASSALLNLLTSPHVRLATRVS